MCGWSKKVGGASAWVEWTEHMSCWSKQVGRATEWAEQISG